MKSPLEHRRLSVDHKSLSIQKVLLEFSHGVLLYSKREEIGLALLMFPVFSKLTISVSPASYWQESHVLRISIY